MNDKLTWEEAEPAARFIADGRDVNAQLMTAALARIQALELADATAKGNTEELIKDLQWAMQALAEEHAKVGCGWGKSPVGDYCPICDELINYAGG